MLLDKNLRILIIGGTGLLGSEIVKEFTHRGVTLFATTRQTTFSESPNYFVVDFLNTDRTLDLIHQIRPDIVIQAAWFTDPLKYRHSIQNTLYSQASIELATAVRKLCIPWFIGIGSAAELGIQEKGEVSEKENSTKLYSLAKNNTRLAIEEVLKGSKTKFIWLRPFQVYGQNEHPLRLFPSLVSTIRRGETFQVLNSEFLLDWITSHDVARALAWSIEKELEGTLEVGTGTLTSVGVFCVKVSQHLGLPSHLVRLNNQKSQEFVERPADIKNVLFRSGWTPILNLNQGIPWALRTT